MNEHTNKNYRLRDDNIINIHQQYGYTHKMTVRDILKYLGAELCDNADGTKYWKIDDNDETLNIYPRTLEDDGMGYGVNEKYIISTDLDKDKKYINLFIDDTLQHVDLWMKSEKWLPYSTCYLKDDDTYTEYLIIGIKLENNILKYQIKKHFSPIKYYNKYSKKTTMWVTVNDIISYDMLSKEGKELIDESFK